MLVREMTKITIEKKNMKYNDYWEQMNLIYMT